MSRADVAVVGGGAIGACVAWALTRRGQRVTLLDVKRPGRATDASAGGLWAAGESLGLGCGVILHEMRTRNGEGPADTDGPHLMPPVFMDFLLSSNRRFHAVAEELRAQGGIDIENEEGTGLLYLLYDERQQRHAHAILQRLGADSDLAEEWSVEQAREQEPQLTPDLLGAVHFPGDNQVNPMLLAEGFKRAACAGGARFVPDAQVTGFEREGSRVTGVETTQGFFACGAVVNAAGAWSGQIAALAGTELPVFPVRGQIVCTETLEKSLRFNLSAVDCYVLQKAHGEILIGSTTEHCDFDADVTFEDVARLAAGARRAVPGLQRANVKRTWAGLRPGTPDEFPILGPDPEVGNLFHATGGFRTGIVAAPLSGEIVAAAIVGEEPPFSPEPFQADRFPRGGTA